MVAGALPLRQDAAAEPKAILSAAKRTFWEKMCLLHEDFTAFQN